MKENKYHQNYYHTTKNIIKCPYCNKDTNQRTLPIHIKSSKCMLIRQNTELQNELNKSSVK